MTTQVSKNLGFKKIGAGIGIGVVFIVTPHFHSSMLYKVL